MRAFDPSSPPKGCERGRRALGVWAGLLLGLASACSGLDGQGEVRVRFSTGYCKPGTTRNLARYGWKAGYLATERFGGQLSLLIQRHQVDVEESDGLVALFSLDALLKSGVLIVERGRIIRSDPSLPVVVRTSTAPGDASVALSLFGTCPEFPTHYARDGRLVLTRLTLAEDPDDTGEGERLAGTLTSTIGRANAEGPVGLLEASFDFSPPRRPLTDFK